MFDECTSVWELTGDLCSKLTREVGGIGCIVSRVIGDVLVQVAEFATDGRTFQLGRGFLVTQFPVTAAVLDDGVPRVASTDDPAPDAAETAVLEDLGVRTVLMLSLQANGAAWGLVELYRIEPSTFGDDEVAAASRFVHAAAARLSELV